VAPYQDAILTPVDTSYGPLTADVDFVDRPDLAGLTPAQVLALVPKAYSDNHFFLVIVDGDTVASTEAPVLVVSLWDEEDSKRGDTFRAAGSATASVQANLALANVDFAEYQAGVDSDGILRGP
jgi:hypothetical protein